MAGKEETPNRQAARWGVLFGAHGGGRPGLGGASPSPGRADLSVSRPRNLRKRRIWQRRDHLPPAMGAALLHQLLHEETVSGDRKRLQQEAPAA